MLESLEVSGWEDPGASADWARLRQLTALTSLTLTTCQYPRYDAFTEVCVLRPEGHHNTCLSPEMECHTLQFLPSSASHAACASQHGSHSHYLQSQQPAPDENVSRALTLPMQEVTCSWQPAGMHAPAAAVLPHSGPDGAACRGYIRAGARTAAHSAGPLLQPLPV